MVVELFALPKGHLIRNVLKPKKKLLRRSVTKGSNPRFVLVQVMNTIETAQPYELEIIAPTPLGPWRKSPFEQITYTMDKDNAVKMIEELSETVAKVLYLDASARRSNLGAAVAILDTQRTTERAWQDIGTKENWTVLATELTAIHKAITMVQSGRLADSGQIGQRGSGASTGASSQP